MTKKALLVFVFFFLCSIAHASEKIKSFNSDIIVNRDNSIDVTETIVYTTDIAKHGIYRDMYPYSSQNREMIIKSITVSPDPYQISTEGKFFRIKIGDPNKTFSGEKTYIIKYKATNAVAQYDNLDEIYWNVTGHEWGMPIEKSTSTVLLPAGFTASQTSCYFGVKGSSTVCDGTNRLNPHEGLTVAVGFPKGIVFPYQIDYTAWIIGGIFPVLTLAVSLFYWYRRGRDPKGKGVIIPQYDVPDALTPMEVGGIVYEKIANTYISAEIIYLATQGYIKIRELEGGDYELTKLKESDDVLMTALFSDSTVLLSNLKNVFYSYIKDIRTVRLDGLVARGYYKNLGNMKNPGIIAGFIIGLFWIMIAIHVSLSPIIYGGLILSVIIIVGVARLMPAKTEKGVETKEYLLGLKEYLDIAEKDRINFHNAPEKSPEVFEKLLPYAMVFGVEKAWAKEFESIYLNPPTWYTGSYNSHFNSLVFMNSLSSFNTYAVSSLTSTPRSSGSGGGGFSGGGGGGGGGGSW